MAERFSGPVWEGMVERAGRALAELNEDGLPDWDLDLDDRARDYWLHEAEVALLAAFGGSR